MKVVAIIQARMGSTRLPGKVLRSLAGRPMIHQVIERVQSIPQLQGVTVATTTSPQEEALLECLRGLPNVSVYRGSEDDVLARYWEAAHQESADVVVRITADCPLISPTVSAMVIDDYLEHAKVCDYVSNIGARTFPRGLDTEVFSFEALDRAHREATATAEREHVTPYIRNRPEVFRLRDVVSPQDLHHLRWTVDTPEDLELVSRVFEALHKKSPLFDYQDVLQLLEAQPELSEINRKVRQKEIGQ